MSRVHHSFRCTNALAIWMYVLDMCPLFASHLNVHAMSVLCCLVSFLPVTEAPLECWVVILFRGFVLLFCFALFLSTSHNSRGSNFPLTRAEMRVDT